MKIDSITLTSFLLFFNMAYGFSQSGGTFERKAEFKTLISNLESKETSAKDYILGLFDKYDIVVLQERDHRELSQYSLIIEVISDERFIDKVGNIHTEVGVSNSFNSVNSFLQNDSLEEFEVHEKILQIIRNNDFEPIWEKYNYPFFLENLYGINKPLSEDLKIVLYPSDMEFSWDNCMTSLSYYGGFILKNYLKFGNYYRDKIIGNKLVENIQKVQKDTLQKRKKHLIIMNSYHAYFTSDKCAAWYVKKKYPKSTVNVMIHKTSPFSSGLIKKGMVDAAFKVVDKSDLGFDLKDTPIGKVNLFENSGNLSEQKTIQDLFFGYVFYKPIEEHILAEGYPGFIDKNFMLELKRRFKIRRPFKNIEKLNLEEYNEVNVFKYEEIDKLIEQRESWMLK